MAPLKGYCTLPVSSRCARRDKPTKPGIPMSPERAEFWRRKDRQDQRPGVGRRSDDGYRAQRAKLQADGRSGYAQQRAERAADGPMCEDKPLSRDDAMERLSQRLTFHILDHWEELESVVESYELHRKAGTMGAAWVIEQTRAHAETNAKGLKPSGTFVTVGANARAAEEFTLRCVQRLKRRLPNPAGGFSYEELDQVFEQARVQADRRLKEEKERAVSYYEEVMDKPEDWKRWPPFWAPATFRGDQGGE